MNGIVVLNKEKGMTSFDVVRKVKRVMQEKHVGHTGTLDPLAEGVLVVCLGDSCKLVKFLESDDKIYEAGICIGLETDTYDITGKVLNDLEVKSLTEEVVDECLNSFLGKSIQEAPIYSALKINGKKLYEYARNNIEVEVPKREIEVFSIKRTSSIEIKDNKAYFTFNVHVSKGTYIRSLCHDIGVKLNLCATMTSLIRTKAGRFDIAYASSLEELENKTCTLISNYDATGDYVTLSNPTAIRLCLNGQKLNESFVMNCLSQLPETLRICDNDKLLGIYKYYPLEKVYRAERIWN